jgi:hypothetical protein
MSEPEVSAKALRALLGPGESELTCEECFEMLDRYVEADIAGRDADEEVPRMRAHLIGCPACAEDHQALHDFVSSGPRPTEDPAS